MLTELADGTRLDLFEVGARVRHAKHGLLGTVVAYRMDARKPRPSGRG